MILIFSTAYEVSTSDVMGWLEHYGEEVVRINADDDLFKFSLINKDGIYFTNTETNKTYNLLDAKSCWWRRTGISKRNFTLGEPRKEFIVDDTDLTPFVKGPKNLLYSETVDLKDYILRRVYDNCKINIGSPWRYGLNKLEVLDIAASYGLKTPDYEIISNLNQIENSEIQEEFVTKSIAEGIYEMIENKNYYTYTESHKKEDFAGSNVTVFPSMIMNIIKKQMEIRAFFLDGEFYSMAIMSQSLAQTSVDFRKYSDARPNKTETYKLPKHTEDKLKKVFKHLDLNCGSVDLIVNEKGEYVFLEINPVGQYAMTSMPCNYNLDKLIAKYLIHGNTNR
jgi:ATP-GRASP peptide maturase of grasp-with-spasm system